MNYRKSFDQSGAQSKLLPINPMKGVSGKDGVDFDYESKVWGGNRVRVSPTYLNALRLKYCLEDLEGVKGKVLEVGCGAGGMAKAIKAYRPDLDVYGCDISREAIDAAKQTPQGVTFEVEDAYGLQHEDRTFDAVLMFDVLEHLDNPAEAVNEIHNCMVPGGLFHLFVPCEGAIHTLHGVLSKAGWRAKEQYGGHIQPFTAMEVERMLMDSGFGIVTRRWSGHLINQLADVAYFSALGIRGRNTSTSVEGHLELMRPGVLATLLRLSKSVVAAASYYESKYLGWLPGWGVHFLTTSN